jgi:hypothetical protein
MVIKMSEKSLETIVGKNIYSTWVKMLRSLVPQGRTHRLAPMIAGMLQYAVDEVYEKQGDGPEEGTVAHALVMASESYEVADAYEYVKDFLEKLFNDAGVEFKRVNARGQEYSVAESALYEFISWYLMPWED